MRKEKHTCGETSTYSPKNHPFPCGHCGEAKMNRKKADMEGGIKHTFLHRLSVLDINIYNEQSLEFCSSKRRSRMKYIKLVAVFAATHFLFTFYVSLSYSPFYVLFFFYFMCDLVLLFLIAKLEV